MSIAKSAPTQLGADVPNLGADELDQCLVADDETPVLLDLWAPWCQPCVAQAPTLKRFGRETAGKLRVVKVDIDKHPSVAQRFAVRGIPTLILLKGGAEWSRRVGVQTREQLRQWMLDAGLQLGVGPADIGGEGDPMALDGAFYGDPALRDYLVNRLVELAEQGGVCNRRFPTWTDGQGTIACALVRHHDPLVFARVTGLPSSFGPVLHFADVESVDAIRAVFERIPAGADVRGAATRLLEAWLGDASLTWPEFLGDRADALRHAWLALTRRLLQGDPPTKADWDELRGRAEALNTDDPYKAIEDYFGRLLAKLSPMPASDDAMGWRDALLMYGSYFVRQLAMYSLGWRTQEFAMDGIRHYWHVKNTPKNYRELSIEEKQEWRRRYEAANAEVEAAFASQEPLRGEPCRQAMKPMHARMQEQLRAVLSL